MAHAVASEELNVTHPHGNQKEQERGMFIEVQHITSTLELGLPKPSFTLVYSNAEVMGDPILG